MTRYEILKYKENYMHLRGLDQVQLKGKQIAISNKMYMRTDKGVLTKEMDVREFYQTYQQEKDLQVGDIILFRDFGSVNGWIIDSCCFKPLKIIQ